MLKISRGRSEALALLALAGLILWFAGEMVLGEKVPFFRDLGPYFYPMRFSLAESLRRGELPLWIRQMAAGFPLLADFQSAAFYPPHLAFALFPFFSAVAFVFIFHYAVAASGTYFLCRHWGYPRHLSIVGAILFTFGGVTVSLINLLNHFQSAVWLPWVVLTAERCFRICCWRRFTGFTVVALLQLLAGSPEFYGMSMVLAALAGWRLRAAGESITCMRIAGVLIGGNCIAVGLAMVQIAPTIELFVHSRRSESIPTSEAVDWSLSPYGLFNLFFLDKEVDPTVLSGLRLFFSKRTPFLVSYYLGAASLLGLVFWTACSSPKEKLALLSLVVVSLLLAFGAHTPVYPFLLSQLPALRLVRFPEKYFFITYGILWFMALRGLASFLDTERYRQKKMTGILCAVVALFLVFYVLLMLNTDVIVKFVSDRLNATASYPAVKIAPAVLVSVERQLIVTIGIAVLFFATKTGLARRDLCHVLLALVVFVDLERAHRGYQYLLDPSFIQKGPRVLAAPDADFNRILYYPGGKTLHPDQYAVLGQPTFAQAISLVGANLLPNTGMFHGFEYFQEIDAFSRRPYIEFLRIADRLEPEKLFCLVGALNIKYVVSLRPLSQKGITLVRHDPEYPSWLYKVDRTVPRVYVVGKSRTETDPRRILGRLASLDFDPMREVFVDREVPLGEGNDPYATSRIVRYENQSVVVEASLTAPGVMVLADSFYPGWKAYVNGKETAILRANYFFRGLPLPTGRHRIEFRYEPLSFKIGLIGSIATLLGLVSVGVIAFWRKRQRHAKSVRASLIVQASNAGGSTDRAQQAGARVGTSKQHAAS
ncbi:MAG TPA: YfhO family protein [Candidatus Eisenbacteria bacterium]|nr:YfhO family protein [Candidatus Eisenbacteria bacterium]